MSRVMKSDASAGDAYAEKDLGSDQADIWITVSLSFSADTLAYWDLFASGRLVGLMDSGDSSVDFIYVTGTPSYATGVVAGGGSPIADVVNIVEYHRVTDDVCDLYLNGALVGSDTDSSGTDIRFVRAGQFDADTDPTQVVYFTSVKVGTTRGGSELFADDFSDGTLNAWTSTAGDVTVTGDPLAPSLAISTAPGLDADTFTVRRTI